MLSWTYPILLWLGYIASHIYQALLRRSPVPARQPSSRRRRADLIILSLLSVLCCNLVATAGLYIATSYSNKNDKAFMDCGLSISAVAAFYAARLLPDPDQAFTFTQVDLHTWLLSLLAELILLLYHHFGSHRRVLPPLVFEWGMSFIVLGSVRILVLLVLIGLSWITTQRIPDSSHFGDDPTQPLLRKDRAITGSGHARHYGAKKPNDAQNTSWTDYLFGFGKLFPFLWYHADQTRPAGSKTLQLRAIFCFVLLIIQRAINIITPHQLGVLVVSLGQGKLPHKQILLYVLFRGLQGQQGVIGSLRAVLWIPISQSTYRRLSSAVFEHVLMLSLDFHLSKRIGEVTSALSKGGTLNTFLDALIFQLFPMVADLWIAAGYFLVVFDASYSLIVVTITWFYLYLTIYMAKYRGRARREMAKRERMMEGAKTDALLSYETVHQSGAVPIEMSRFQSLVGNFQEAEYSVFFSLNMLNVVQNSVFTLGTLLVCYLDAYQISTGQQTVAMFVTLLTYIAQLQAPLNFFGSFYTQVQNNLVDAERMLELFNEVPTITDAEDAKDLETCRGRISFRDVSFAYHQGQHQALRGISFDVDAGTSTAIVGESGSGKSTILKLLFRFYDVDQGAIEVDGTDIRSLRLESLRSHIGVVPQDTVLFNDTLIYNLRYAKPDATDDEVYTACAAASIHKKILKFPQGYLTVVGERGLKLSGGERQRIAIARAFLRSPRILLLDEATASLDSATERQIQGSLEGVSQGRTTITIAHRLSTITEADQIIVLSDGRIVEKGRHSVLVGRNGVYGQMWRKQNERRADADAAP
ncbi:heavy metal tolerance protein [Xylaria bambusicola]|uniref:heavy metal tolerance protein n=1 Tax=Xylaria bambusicola TaxID=326684 RepID=UPI002008E8D0|nr:heavy metal tolerance protein [Xylaria bambusicola]KAI0517011.1 heavy metal tolerance protein [Xylaria bambusicola]